MITEKDRILALILIVMQGPTPEQIKRGKWSPQTLAYGHDVLKALAFKIRDGMHRDIPDSLVKLTLAGDL